MMDYNWYLNAKNSYPDAIIFVRIGELYRTYGNDAIREETQTVGSQGCPHRACEVK